MATYILRWLFVLIIAQKDGVILLRCHRKSSPPNEHRTAELQTSLPLQLILTTLRWTYPRFDVLDVRNMSGDEVLHKSSNITLKEKIEWTLFVFGN